MDDQLEEILELRRRARSRLRLPAMFMMIMAMLGIAFAGVIVLSPHAEGAMPRGVFVLAIMWCGFIGYGAWETDRLGNCRMACIGAWMAVIPVPVPSYLLWMIGAILALVALNDPAVRMAFASNAPGRQKYFEREARRKARLRGKNSRDLREADSAEPVLEEFSNQEHGPPEEENREPLPPPEPATLRDRRKNFAGQLFDAEFNESPAPGEGDRRKQQTRREANKFVRQKDDARRAVATASTILLIIWTLGATITAGILFLMIFSIVRGNTMPADEHVPTLIAIGTICPIVVTTGLFGAWQLRQFRSYAWGIISASLLISMFASCGIGLVLGIYVLILLNRPGVWHLFQRDEQEY